MSKETMAGGICACGQRIYYQDQHWPHCKMNPANIEKHDRVLAAKLRAVFSKAELAQIADHGPVQDKPIRARRKGKSNTAKTKQPRKGGVS